MYPRAVASWSAALLLLASNGCFSPSVPESGVLCGVDHDCPPSKRCELVTSSCIPVSWPAVAKLRFEPFASSFEATVEGSGVRVSLLDAQDELVPISGGRLHLGLAPAPVDVSLTDEPTTTLQGGVASFAKVKFDRPAKRLQLVATGGSLSTSSPFFDVLPNRPMLSIPAPASVQGCAEIAYTVQQAQDRPVDLLVEVDPDGPDGPAPFHRATQAASSPGKAGVHGVQTTRQGAERSFAWNSSADVVAADATATLRLTAIVDGLSGTPATRAVQTLNGLHIGLYGQSQHVFAVADVDRDGWPDLVRRNGTEGLAVEYGPFTASTSGGQPQGAATSTDIALPDEAESAAVGDFDHDGKLDLVLTTTSAAVFIAYAGAAPRSFGAPSGVFATATRDVVAADVNGDGRDDFAGIDRDDGSVSIWFQHPTDLRRFDSKGIFVGTNDTGRIALGDLDHNGELDLVVGRKGAPVAMFGQWSGKFGRTPFTLPGFEGAAAQVTDLDHDGQAEVAVLGPAGFQLLEFSPGEDTATDAVTLPGFAGDTFTLGDVDGDGQLDVVTAGSAGVSVHLHVKDRTKAAFAAAVAVGSRPADVLAVVDLDRDGRMDVIAGGTASMLYLNQTARRCGAGLDGPRGGEGSNTLPLRDLNGDGKLDLVHLDDRFSHHADVRFGRGDGTFSSPTPLVDDDGTPVTIDDLAIADLDQDGLADRIELVAGDSFVTLRAPDLAHPGTLTSRTLQLGIEARAIAVADVDLDGAPDVLAMGSNQAEVLPGDPRHPGEFLERKALPGAIQADATSCSFSGCRFRVDDLDGDGWPEIIVQNQNRLLVYPGGSAHPGELGAPGITDFEAVQLAAVGDVVGDRQPELVVIDSNLDNQLDALAMQPDGTLRSEWLVPLPSDFFSAAIADFDHDGHAEIALGAAHDGVRIIAPRDVPTGSSVPVGTRLFGNGTVSADDLDDDGQTDLLACGQSCLAFPSRMIVSAMAGADFWSQVGYLERFVTGDLTGDGLVDLLVGSHLERQLLVPSNHFQILADAPEGIQTFADFDHDGFDDLVTSGGVMNVYLNKREAGFQRFSCGTPLGITLNRVADVDRDGDLDVVQWSDTGIRLVRGVMGDCVSTAPFVSFDVLDTVQLAEVRDLNNDGWPDVVTALQSRKILVSLQRPDAPGEFAPAQEYESGGDAAVGDIDHDGMLDLVFVLDGVHAYRGSTAAPGTFLPEVALIEDAAVSGTTFGKVLLGDIDGDGWLDLVLGALGGNTQVYLHDTTPAAFHYAYDTIGASTPDQPAYGRLLDLDSDGRLDFFFTDRRRGSMLVRGR